MYVCMYVCMCVCMYVCVCICVYVCMYVWMCVCVCLCVCCVCVCVCVCVRVRVRVCDRYVPVCLIRAQIVVYVCFLFLTLSKLFVGIAEANNSNCSFLAEQHIAFNFDLFYFVLLFN